MALVLALRALGEERVIWETLGPEPGWESETFHKTTTGAYTDPGNSGIADSQ